MAPFINLYFISIIDLAASDVYLFFQTFSQRLLNLNKQLQLQLNFYLYLPYSPNLGRRFLYKEKLGFSSSSALDKDSAPCKIVAASWEFPFAFSAALISSFEQRRY
jgi:hypothetical protein